MNLDAFGRQMGGVQRARGPGRHRLRIQVPQGRQRWPSERDSCDVWCIIFWRGHVLNIVTYNVFERKGYL